MKKNSISTKLSPEARTFLIDLEANINIFKKSKGIPRDKKISYTEGIELIANYFKLNNDKYLELIKLYGEKNNGQ